MYRARPGVDTIDEYSRRLVAALNASGTNARYSNAGLRRVLDEGAEPSWILLQYNPLSYARWGLAPDLERDALRVRRCWGAPLAVMVHEPWIGVTDWRTSLVSLLQRAQLRALLPLADVVMASTEALARELGGGAVHLPVAATITPVPTTCDAARDRLGLDGRLAVALFGGGHPTRALEYAERAIGALAEAHGPNGVLILNLGATAPGLRAPRGVEVRSPGLVSAGELSLFLAASDMVLLPFTDGLSTRRSTLMAALAHGRPVVALRGPGTDSVLLEHAEALTLTPVGDPGAFAAAAVSLAADPGRRLTTGVAGRRLYAECFDWPHAARRVASILEVLTPPAPGAGIGRSLRGARGRARARPPRR